MDSVSTYSRPIRIVGSIVIIGGACMMAAGITMPIALPVMMAGVFITCVGILVGQCQRIKLIGKRHPREDIRRNDPFL
jgi:uncharacterized membrane protein